MSKKYIIKSNEIGSGYRTEKSFVSYQDIFNEGYKALQEDNLKIAEQRFNFLFEENNKDPLVLFFIAGIELKKKHLETAKILLKKCLEIHNHQKEINENYLDDGNLSSVYNNLGYIYTNKQERDKAEQSFLKAVKLREATDIWSNLGSLYVNQGSPDKAIEYLDKALKIKPENNFALWNKALSLLEKGEYGKGFDLYEYGFDSNDRVNRQFNDKDTPFWNGEKGKTIVIYGEQGIGDEIMFSSILPEVQKDNNIIFECHPRLTNIFRNSFDFPIFGTRKATTISWSNLYDFDFKLSIASLGKFFRRQQKDFPKHQGYLKPDQELKEFYKNKLDDLGEKPKIGISWQGGIPKTNKFERSIDLDLWKEIFKHDATFINLQYTPDSHLEAEKYNMVHWQEMIDDYDHTAACVSNLDLVISVCTSVIHLSGALNIPCWVLTPSKPAWRYKIKGEMDWYPSVKLYRQKGEDWDEVLKKIEGDLCKQLQKNIAA